MRETIGRRSCPYACARRFLRRRTGAATKLICMFGPDRTGRSGPSALPDRLPLDDVVDPDDLGFTGELDPGIGQDRHQSLAVGLELLARVPDLAHAKILPVRTEAHVIRHSVGRKLDPGGLVLPQCLVVLLSGQVGGLEAYEDARLARVRGRGRRLGNGAGHWMA